MADTPQTLASILSLLSDGQRNAISAAILRELAVSVPRLFEIYTSTSYANDAAAAAGGVPVGQIYRNGNLLQVRLS